MACGLVYSQEYNSGEVEAFRRIRDEQLRDAQSTPLLAADFAKFDGLKYFPLSGKYQVRAKFIKTTEKKSFLMLTSTGGTRKYIKIGTLSFKLDDKDVLLGAYVYEWAPDHPKAKEEITELFIPFKDLTNGQETYSAGRYVHIRMPKDGEDAILDFNLAYNPNCAYGNEKFACTLPPKENFLQVEIKAGEKKYISPSGKTTH